MLQITIDEQEIFVDDSEFVTIKRQTITLEHSLVSLAKWEAKWHKPFISNDPKTEEELLDYFRCMTITQNVNPFVYHVLLRDHHEEISKYLADPQTATKISAKRAKGHRREIITAEIIYYWMIALNIPFECQKWHLNRLLTLIDVVGLKSNPEEMPKQEVLRSNRELNAARKKKLNTKG